MYPEKPKRCSAPLDNTSATGGTQLAKGRGDPIPRPFFSARIPTGNCRAGVVVLFLSRPFSFALGYYSSTLGRTGGEAA